MKRMGMAVAMSVAVLGAAQGFGPAKMSAAQGPPPLATDLASLEAAVVAAPDDLRAANDYRMAVIPLKQYDRAIAFFKKLTTDHPSAANAHLNYGFAYVDKIPDAGA